MKKILLLSFACSLIAANAFAVTTFESTGPKTGTTPTGAVALFKCSKDVTVGVVSGAESYAAASGHRQGTRIFGIATDDPYLYYQDASANGNPATDVAGASILTKSGSDNFSSWTSL